MPRLPPVARDNVHHGTKAWLSTEITPPDLEGYAPEPSVPAGGVLRLHVEALNADRYRVVIFRIGWYHGRGGRIVACLPSCHRDEPARRETIPASDPVTGEDDAGWPVTDALRIPSSWVSGYYVAKLVATAGGAGVPGRVYFVVTNRASRAPIVVVAPVNTWQAYNNWGGKSLYDFSSSGGVPANHVSFERPLAVGLGRQSPLVWELPFVRFLERLKYDATYVTDIDVQRDPRLLQRHRLVIGVGHGEYWSHDERDAFDAAVDAGVNLVFTGANNGYWQIRYEDDEHTIVEYKSLTADPDPEPTLKTALFRELTPPRYECQLFGVQHQGAFRHSGDPQFAYTVTPEASTHPWFPRTGFVPGDSLPDLVGREWDSVPAYAQACPHPNLRVLFHADTPRGPADAVTYTAPSGGTVFSAGSLQFAWGLDDVNANLNDHPHAPDPRLQRFVVNMLDALAPHSRAGRYERASSSALSYART